MQEFAAAKKEKLLQLAFDLDMRTCFSPKQLLVARIWTQFPSQQVHDEMPLKGTDYAKLAFSSL